MKKSYVVISVLLISIIALVTVIVIKSLDNNKHIDGLATAGTNIIMDNNKENTNYEVSTYVTDEIKGIAQEGLSSAELERAYTPEYLKEASDSIAIVRVISLDGATTDYNSMVGMTYGKLLINNSLNGSLKDGDVIDYMKPGGIVTVADFEKNQPKAANEKRDYLREQSGVIIDKEKAYYNLKMEDDIDIEAGKTYLAYLKYSQNTGKYEIIGLENGLKEIDIPREDKKITKVKINIDEAMVKNNTTKKLEKLNEYIEKNIQE